MSSHLREQWRKAIASAEYPMIDGQQFQAPVDVRRANGEKFRSPTAHYVDECYTCGRGLTQSAVDNGYWIHMQTSGRLYHKDDPDQFTDPQSQGAFPVGSECAKKIPKEYKFKRGQTGMV